MWNIREGGDEENEGLFGVDFVNALDDLQAVFQKDKVLVICVREAGELTSNQHSDLSYLRDKIHKSSVQIESPSETGLLWLDP